MKPVMPKIFMIRLKFESSSNKSFEGQLDKIKDIHKENSPPPSVHVLGDFNFSDIVWPD